jgi:hypothetical protein
LGFQSGFNATGASTSKLWSVCWVGATNAQNSNFFGTSVMEQLMLINQRLLVRVLGFKQQMRITQFLWSSAGSGAITLTIQISLVDGQEATNAGFSTLIVDQVGKKIDGTSIGLII